jgi:hypothetical protein
MIFRLTLLGGSESFAMFGFASIFCSQCFNRHAVPAL